MKKGCYITALILIFLPLLVFIGLVVYIYGYRLLNQHITVQDNHTKLYVYTYTPFPSSDRHLAVSMVYNTTQQDYPIIYDFGETEMLTLIIKNNCYDTLYVYTKSNCGLSINDNECLNALHTKEIIDYCTESDFYSSEMSIAIVEGTPILRPPHAARDKCLIYSEDDTLTFIRIAPGVEDSYSETLIHQKWSNQEKLKLIE